MITQTIFLVIGVIISMIYCTQKKIKDIKIIIFSIILALPMILLIPFNIRNLILSIILSILYTCGCNDILYRQIDDFPILLILILSFFYSTDIKQSILQFAIISILAIILIILNCLNGLGGGDIKMLCVLSPLLNLNMYFIVLFLSCTSAIIGYFISKIILLIKEQDTKNYTIPFGIYIYIGTYLVTLCCYIL